MKHGGDISLAAAAFERANAHWLDLSTGIAPEPYPVPALPDAVWQRLPQHGELETLLAAALSAYGANAEAAIVAAAGTQSLIQIVPQLRPGADVRVLAPTYSEHEISWRRTACSVTTIDSLDDRKIQSATVVVLTNPNNPDGRQTSRAKIIALADELNRRGGLVVVDEAFADVASHISVADYAGRPGLLILRSFGKFFGLAGVRLGFALGHPSDVSRLTEWLGPWAVSGPAIAIGTTALSDKTWIAAATERYGLAAQRLDSLLEQGGLNIVGGTSLFRLAQHGQAQALHHQLAQAGILTRKFEDDPTWLRFGLPGAPADWDRLSQALSVIRSSRHATAP